MEHLHLKTPLILSNPLSVLTKRDVYCKLDNLQPPGSFKIRGIGKLCQQAKENGKERIVSSSGGNAGLAAAFAAKCLGMESTIVVPATTPFSVRELISREGATVEVVGKVFNHANERALELADGDDVQFVHPFDNPITWDGHSTIIVEIEEQLDGIKPDLIVVCVGGGGLLCGLILGCRKVGWNDVPILAMETAGADCFNQSLTADRVVTLPDITSIAKSLGALAPTEMAINLSKEHPVLSHVVTDAQAVSACLAFADDHRMLVEPACGASLAALYSHVVDELVEAGKLSKSMKNVVMVVCGGSAVTIELLNKWTKDFNLQHD